MPFLKTHCEMLARLQAVNLDCLERAVIPVFAYPLVAST